MTGGTLLAISYQSDNHFCRVYFEENYSKSIWQETSVLMMMTSDTFPAMRTQPNLYAKKTNTFLFPGESGDTVSGNVDGFPSASSPSHMWDMHLLCLSLSHQHKWATHPIRNMTWNEIQSLRADTSRCWKHVFRACQVWVLASPACLPWCHLLWVTSGMGLSRLLEEYKGLMGRWSGARCLTPKILAALERFLCLWAWHFLKFY